MVIHPTANTELHTSPTIPIKLFDFSAWTNFKNQFSQFSTAPRFPPTSTPKVTKVSPLYIIDTDDIRIANIVPEKSKSQ